MRESKHWLLFAVITTGFWGIWGALIEIPEKAGFPATLGYSVWALTMIPPAVVALKIIRWKLDYDLSSIAFGSIIGLLGAGGQLILFQALRTGPAYLVFPIISLSPMVTILLAYWFLRERTSTRGWLGIALALAAIPLLSYQEAEDQATRGYLWLILALIVFAAWGAQAFVMRFANRTMRAESIFFYMMVTGIILIPFALLMTDFAQPINWGFSGPVLAALIQSLNSIGALCLVYAFRYGKAMIVAPVTNALAPVITVVISLMIYGVLPSSPIATGMVLAIAAALLLALEEGSEAEIEQAIPSVDSFEG
ncbi:MAG TPA: EamA family transporter [Acidobacteriota bacterium]|nr:EamA family transporter [Acidobacteriota bacterium]